MSVLIFIGVLLVLVLVHELGHFIVAKMFGIRVDEFAFGFPPRLFSIKKGETTYSFNALPLGGYVKIYGENPDDVTADADVGRSFNVQPRIVQAAVIVAGVIFNLLLAWFLLAAIFMMGITTPVDPEYVDYVTNQQIIVSGVHPESPAEFAGMEAGDILLSVSDQDELQLASSPDEISKFVSLREQHQLKFTYLHLGESKEAIVTPVSGIVEDVAAIGIYMDTVGTLSLPLHLALLEGARRTYEFTILTATGLWDFLSSAIVGKSDFSQVTGPVGIVSAVGEAAGIGFANLLFFTALISINLAIINIIPFPALDGGRLLFIIIEAITRKPINVKITNMTNLVGFALLMLLMVAVTWHDVLNILN